MSFGNLDCCTLLYALVGSGATVRLQLAVYKEKCHHDSEACAKIN